MSLLVAAREASQGLWLFIDPESVVGDHRVEALAKKPSVDGSWAKDRLAWMILSEIRKECANGFPRGPMFLENAAAVFVSQLGYVLYDAAPRVESSRALSDAKLATVIEYVETNLHRNITLTELANLVDLTPRYFCAAFKEATGRPPHQFQIERRIERAKGLLHNPNVSLTDCRTQGRLQQPKSPERLFPPHRRHNVSIGIEL